MSDSSDGETTKGWTLVNQDGDLADFDDGASSSSSCDVALDEDVVHFRHIPRRSSSSVSSGSPTTPVNLTVSSDGCVAPKTPTNETGLSTRPANFWAHQSGKESLESNGQDQPSPASNTIANANNLQCPINQWPQGARPKTTNHPVSPLDESQLSSSNSTIIEGQPSMIEPPSCHSPDGGFKAEEVDDTDEEEDKFAIQVSEEMADTSSMSSIEILNMPSDGGTGNTTEEIGEQEEGVVYRIMQPLMSSSALIPDTDQPNNPTETVLSHTTSDSDSDFVRVDQSMLHDANGVEQEAPPSSPNPENDENAEDVEYSEAAAALPAVEEHHQCNDSFRATAPLSVSSYSLPGVPPQALVASPPHTVDDMGHERRRRPHHRHFPDDDEGDMDDIPGASHRAAGDEALERRYFARRLQRETSLSVSSSGSDLSSFSLLGLRRQSSRRSINRQHSDDMSEISSVFTDGSNDLPANMMIGTTKPAPKQYKHKRAERLNARLNYLVLLVLASVCALGIGHYIGSYQEKYYRHQIREGQVKRLRELQDDLITCLDKRTTETDDKKTFADMVISLLGDNVKQDEITSDVDKITDDNDLQDDDFSIDCNSCSDDKNRYSETCNTLCVQGGFWAELDEAISELPIPLSESYGVGGEDASTMEDLPEDVFLHKEISDADIEVNENDELIEPMSDDANSINLEPENSHLPTQCERESTVCKEQIQDDIEKASSTNLNSQNSNPSSQPGEEPKTNQEQVDDIDKEFPKPENVNKPNVDEQIYSSEEMVRMEQKLKRKEDRLEEEEIGYIAEKVLVMPQSGVEQEVVDKVVRKEDKLEEEENGFIAEKVIVMPQSSTEEEVINKVETDDDDDDTWIQIEIEDDDNIETDLIQDKEDRSESIQHNVEEDSIFVNEEEPVQEESEPSQMDTTASTMSEILEESATLTRLEELEEQLLMAQKRADMWQKKYVEDHHHKPHPEVIIVESTQENRETAPSEDLEYHKKIEGLEEQLVLAKGRADMWQSLYLEKSHTDRQARTIDKDMKSDEEPKTTSKKDSTTFEDSTEKEHRDTCGPLGCFNIFESILTNFLNSAEGKEFLRFANLTQVLNNATFWEELVLATNISAYTISDAVYQSWVEFQDYVKSAQTNDFISSFSAILARAGQSVATAFGTVKNYSATMGDKAWNSVRNFTSDTMDQHNINLSNISQAAQDAFEKVKNISADSKVSGSVKDVWNTMRNFSEDAFRGQNLSLSNLKEKVAAAWNTVRNMSAQVVSNDTKMKFSEVAGHVKENVKDIGKTVHETLKSVKDVVGDWHWKKKQHKKHHWQEKHEHLEETEDVFGKTDENKDPSQEKRSRKHTRTDSPPVEKHHSENGKNKKEQNNAKHQDRCKGKKCNGKKHEDKTKHQTFGPENKKEKNKHQKYHQHRDEHVEEMQTQENHHHHNEHRDKHHRGKHKEHHHRHKKAENKANRRGKHQKDNHFHHQKHNKHKDEREFPQHHAQWDVDWEDVLDIFNMNCYGNTDCLNHQRRDAARLYDELTEYKKWLKAHHRKKELKQVRKFLEALGEFLSEPILNDEVLEDLKEDFEDVLEHVGRFVQDQHERSAETSTVDPTVEESEENSTVILDLDLLNKEKSEESSQSVPERRKFAGYGYQSSVDDDENDNWFLRRAKDREEHHQEDLNDEDSKDSNWYLHWMQGRTDSRTGVTVWDMYRWITDRFDQREHLRQYDEVNWFLKRP